MIREPLLSIRHLTKSFNGVTVVDNAHLEIRAGEIHALVGPNGCGKSTIIKILSGFHRPDPGADIHLFGARLHYAERSLTQRLGLGFVHQDLALVPTLSVTENLALGAGYPTAGLWRIDWRTVRWRAADVLDQYSIRATPETPVSELGAADLTLLAIARALSSLPPDRPALLVLDEPTSSLAESEVGRVLDTVRQVAEGGNGVLFVSHRLGEVLSIADRVSVMRDGRIVAEPSTSGLTEEALVELMLGRPLERLVPESTSTAAMQPVLSVRDLSGFRLRDFSCELAPGEIVGVTGLLGSGKTELGRLLSGAQPRRSGDIRIQGRPVRLGVPRDAVRAGIAYLPPDRRTQSGIGALTAKENLTLPGLKAFWQGGRLQHRQERGETLKWMHRASIVPVEPDRQLSTFSGGNQQKLLFSKWFRLNPIILILDEPTQGVDVGAVHDLYQLIRHGADNGLAVLLLSSEWDDLARICHRVLILDRGRNVKELRGHELTADNIAKAVLSRNTARSA